MATAKVTTKTRTMPVGGHGSASLPPARKPKKTAKNKGRDLALGKWPR